MTNEAELHMGATSDDKFVYRINIYSHGFGGRSTTAMDAKICTHLHYDNVQQTSICTHPFELHHLMLATD